MSILKRLPFEKRSAITPAHKAVIEDTRGMCVYGHKARYSLRMDPQLAVDLVAIASASEENLNDFICRQLTYLHSRGQLQPTFVERIRDLEMRVEKIEKTR